MDKSELIIPSMEAFFGALCLKNVLIIFWQKSHIPEKTAVRGLVDHPESITQEFTIGGKPYNVRFSIEKYNKILDIIRNADPSIRVGLSNYWNVRAHTLNIDVHQIIELEQPIENPNDSIKDFFETFHSASLYHELAHIKNQDPLFSNMWGLISFGTGALFSYQYRHSLFSVIIIALAQFLIEPLLTFRSRRKEKKADLLAADMMGTTKHLIAQFKYFQEEENKAYPSLPWYKKFMYNFRRSWFSSTHPSHETRVEYLSSYVPKQFSL